jgi:hypothetical protein
MFGPSSLANLSELVLHEGYKWAYENE